MGTDARLHSEAAPAGGAEAANPEGNGALASGLAAVHAQRASGLLTAVATMACLRASEVAHLQVCYQWFDHLMSYGVPGFEGTCPVHIRVDRRKNDTQCKGHYPAFGR